MTAEPLRRDVLVGGHRISVQEAGRPGQPAILLLHGLASDSTTWQPVIGPLAARGHHVVAVDLLGHGCSAKPDVAYSLDLFVELLRELCAEIALSGATVIGHSLGGAIGAHLAFYHPGTASRLGLVSSGGLGKEVHPVLRAATLPGARVVLGLALNRHTGAVLRSPRLHRGLRLRPEAVVNLSRTGSNLVTPEGRSAFLVTLRSVILPTGQIGSMIDVDRLLMHVPTLIVWSEHDHVIPVRHAHDTHAHLPGSRLELFPGASHEPHRRHAARFVDLVSDFVATTDPV